MFFLSAVCARVRGLLETLDEGVREAQAVQLGCGELGKLGAGLEQPFPGLLQQAGHH